MAVNLSPVGGVAAQFFDNSGNVLTGGKIYTYLAGTTTPATTYTTNGGTIAWSNPIVLDASGRVSGSGEIWLTDSIVYKFVLKDSNDVLIATYDNITGINSNFVNFVSGEETQTATQGQTLFTLTTIQYQPSTDNLLVFVNGSKQISGTNYIETSATEVTFVDGLNVGDVVDFTTATPINTITADAATTTYTPPFVGSVTTNVENKLAESVSVKDFGAVGDGTTDDTDAIQAAVSYAIANNTDVIFPSATYAISDTIIIPQYFNYIYKSICIDGKNSDIKLLADVPAFTSGYYSSGSYPNGTLVTNFGTTLDSHFSQGIQLVNFNFVSSLTNLQSGCIKIQDWHQGSLLKNLFSSVYDTMLYLVNSYYTQVDTVQSDGGSGSFGGARMIFSSNNNLMKVTNCVVVNADVGYRFDGLVDAFEFTNNSVEGVTTGIVTTGQVEDLLISNCYFEGFDLACDFQSYITVEFDNNYVTFGSDAAARFIDYLPSPSNNIIIQENNSFTGLGSTFEQQLFVSKDTTYSAGVTIKRTQTGSGLLSALIKDNTYLTTQADWQQKVLTRGTRANIINDTVVGNYSGRFSTGHNTSAGFDDISSGTTLALSTKIVPSTTQRIYVNIRLNLSGVGFVYVAGEFIGDKFYCFDTSGITVPGSGNNYLTLTTVGGFVQINGTMSAAISTATVGEVRLI